MSARNVIINGNFISFFAGIGGSIIGLERAGLKCVAGYEITTTPKFTPLIKSIDIKNLTPDMLPDATLWECDFPVEGFRSYGKRDINDPRNLLWKYIHALAKVKQPPIILMTYPKDMVRGRMRGRFIEICDHFRMIGYTLQSRLLSTADYKVPIYKEVVTIIASNRFDPANLFPKQKFPHITVKSLLDVFIPKRLQHNELDSYEKIKPLMSKLRPGETIGNYDGKLYSYGRCFWDKPARPLISKVAFNNISVYHPIEDRNLTIEEAKLLTGFPMNIPIHGDYKEQWEQIAQAGYPNFYKHLGEAIYNEIRIAKKKSQQTAKA